MPLLLPRWQAAELENVARHRGMTTAQMVRHVLREFFDNLHAFGPTDDCEQ